MKIFVNTSKSYNVLDKEPYKMLISKIKGFEGSYDNQQITLKWPNDVNATVINGFYIGIEDGICYVPSIKYTFAEIEEDHITKVFIRCVQSNAFSRDNFYDEVFERVSDISQRLPYIYLPGVDSFEAECSLTDKIIFTFDAVVSDKDRVVEVCCMMLSHLIMMFSLDN